MTRAIALAAALTLIGGVADARMPAGGPTPEASWFAGLHNKHDVPCCAPDRDCHRLDPSLVRPTKDGHYEFHATPENYKGAGDDKWHPIDDDAIIRGAALAKLGGNPTGLWVICTETHWPLVGGPSFIVRCAIPPSAT